MKIKRAMRLLLPVLVMIAAVVAGGAKIYLDARSALDEVQDRAQQLLRYKLNEFATLTRSFAEHPEAQELKELYRAQTAATNSNSLDAVDFVLAVNEKGRVTSSSRLLWEGEPFQGSDIPIPAWVLELAKKTDASSGHTLIQTDAEGKYIYGAALAGNTTILSRVDLGFMRSRMLFKILGQSIYTFLFYSLMFLVLGILLNVFLVRKVTRMITVTRKIDENLNLGADATEDDELGQIEATVTKMAQKIEQNRAVITAQEQLLAEILQSLKEAVLVVDARSRKVLECNRTLTTWLGKEREQVLGRRCKELLCPREGLCSQERCLLQELALKGVNTPLEFERKLTIGQSTLEVAATQVRGASGQTEKLVYVYRDITESRRIQRVASESEKLAAIGQLAGGVAREFKDVIGNIIEEATYLRCQLDQERQLQKRAENILLSVEQAAGLTQTLLAFGGAQEMEARILDIHELARQAAGLVEKTVLAVGSAPKIRFGITCKNADKTQALVMADPQWLEQAIMDLCENARDAMPEGGELRMESGRVEIDAFKAMTLLLDEPGHYAYIRITDNGCGMDDKTRARVFEPFFSTKPAAHDGGAMTSGSGLSKVYGIVRQHRGQVQVESTPGEGTVVTLLLPMIPENFSLKTQEQEQQGVLTEQDISKTQTVLVAEDDPDIRMLLREILQTAGYRVIEAIDGEVAVQLFSEATQSRSRIDLVVLDVLMPRRNGWETYDAIRRLNPKAKILFLSAYAKEQFSDRVKAVEGVKYLSKPVMPQVFLNELKTLLTPP